MTTFLVVVGLFFALVNAYYSWERARKLTFLFDTCVKSPLSRFIWKYDAVLAWSLVAMLDIALYGAGK